MKGGDNIDLIVLDKDFNSIGIVDAFTSLIWSRKYYEAGDFELHTMPQYFKLLRSGAYIYRPDAAETGIIETLHYELDETGDKRVSVKGRFLEALLYDRVINTTQNLKGTGEQAIRSLVNKFAINTDKSARQIKKLRLGDLSGVGEEIEMQVTGHNLLEKIYEICKSQQISIALRYDYLNDELVFTVWQGKDRTEEQIENTFATFSLDYENVLSTDYSDSTSDYKNFAYVAGAGEGKERIVIEINNTNGEQRRELYVDARDLQREKDDGTLMDMANYKAILRQRGNEKLAEYKRKTIFEGNIDVNTNLSYKVDFNLGDICTYIDNELEIEVVQRITEITEVYESGKAEITTTFGDQQLNIIGKVRREVR